MHAYLLKSRIRRRRAGVDILIEHYFNVLSNSNGLQKVFFWLESLLFTIWLSAIQLVSSLNAAYLLENAMIACAFFCYFNLQTNEIENSPELYMLLQRITITSNVRTKSIKNSLYFVAVRNGYTANFTLSGSLVLPILKEKKKKGKINKLASASWWKKSIVYVNNGSFSFYTIQFWLTTRSET